MKRAIQIAGLVLGVLFTLFSCYSYVFWGWVTATPLTPPQLKRAQFNAHAWLILTLLGVLISVWLIVMISRRKKESRGFPVVPTDQESKETDV
ncbi:MAG TPA: hypothetical protein VGQ99_18815 [Tepidisphaeraceae bacterium]|nr:hypothetical protein [Tepidisphaeraceae bacterium]